MSDTPKCELCGEPMPAGEEMFKYHGYSGSCPKPPLPKADAASRPPKDLDSADVQLLAWAVVNCHMLARRALARSTSAYDREKWEHALRICEKAGARSQGVLRLSVPTEITDGSGDAASRPGPSAGEPPQDALLHPAHQVFFRAGLIACREYMARFVEAQDPTIAMSIRANWWPSLGKDYGPPRQLDWNEVAEGEYGTSAFRTRTAEEVSPTQEALPIALAFLAGGVAEEEADAVSRPGPSAGEPRLNALRSALAALKLAERGTDNGWIDDDAVASARACALREAVRYVRTMDALADPPVAAPLDFVPAEGTDWRTAYALEVDRRTRAEAAQRTLNSLAAMLGWGNIPPQDVFEAEIRALQARVKESVAAPPETPRCDCGRPLTKCSGCVVEEYQAAHPECAFCMPPRHDPEETKV